MYQQPLALMVKDHSISGPALRTYLGLLSVMDFDNEVSASQKAIAELVADSQPNVSKALRILQAKGIISRSKNKYGITVYKINQDFALKGDIKPLKPMRRRESETLEARS